MFRYSEIIEYIKAFVARSQGLRIIGYVYDWGKSKGLSITQYRFDLLEFEYTIFYTFDDGAHYAATVIKHCVQCWLT